MNKLCERLKLARLSLHLSQDYIAKQMDLSRATVAQIELGNRKVTADELNKFSEIYGFTTDELLNGKKYSEPTVIFARNFSELDEDDQKEILSLMEFKKMMKEQRPQND